MKYYVKVLFTFALLLNGCNDGLDNKQESTAKIKEASISLSKRFIQNSAIELHWNAYPNALSYVLLYGTTEEGLINEVVLEKEQTQYVFDYLEYDTPYLFKLTVIIEDNKEVSSKILQLKIGKQTKTFLNDVGPIN